MILKPIRWVLGRVILGVDRMTSPEPLPRSDEEMARIREATRNLALYHYQACPFCVKVRRRIRRLNLPIELRDAKRNPEWKRELVEKGGKEQVPCLRIRNEDGSERWLYESSDIIAWLEERFPVSENTRPEAA